MRIPIWSCMLLLSVAGSGPALVGAQTVPSSATAVAPAELLPTAPGEADDAGASTRGAVRVSEADGAWTDLRTRLASWTTAAHARMTAGGARLEAWGVPPVAAALGLAGLVLLVLGAASVLVERLRMKRHSSGAGTAASRTSRVRPPRPPPCRDAARLKAALRTRNAA